MRIRFTALRCSAVLCVLLSFDMLVPVAQLRAEIVVSTFEDSRVFDEDDNEISSPNISNSTFEGQPYFNHPSDSSLSHNVPTNIRSGKVTFANDGLNSYGTWAGVGYSQKQATSAAFFWEESDDFVVTPGTGAGPSATWGVIYQDTFGPRLPTLTADVGYVFDSLAITNTYWTWYTMANGDPYGFSGGPFDDGDFFTVRFTNTANNAFIDYDLADFRGATDYIVDAWESVDLSSLQASELNVSFFGSRTDPDYGLLTPAYAAIDNVAVSSIAAVPEPSSLALLAVGGSTGMWFRWRRRRRSVVG